jgi:hypothetical protein
VRPHLGIDRAGDRKSVATLEVHDRAAGQRSVDAVDGEVRERQRLVETALQRGDECAFAAVLQNDVIGRRVRHAGAPRAAE